MTLKKKPKKLLSRNRISEHQHPHVLPQLAALVQIFIFIYWKYECWAFLAPSIGKGDGIPQIENVNPVVHFKFYPPPPPSFGSLMQLLLVSI